MITPAHAFFNWAILRKWFRPWWVVAGSVLPDLPPFAAFFYLLATQGFSGGSGGFFGFVMANGNPNRQPGFMEASFLLSALPLYGLVGLAVLFWRRDWLSALWAGWGLHLLADYLTHVSDAYAPLYPFFPEWAPRGIVSYWEVDYGAQTFQTVQLAAAGAILAWLLGKRLWTRRRLSAGHGAGDEKGRSEDSDTTGRGTR